MTSDHFLRYIRRIKIMFSAYELRPTLELSLYFPNASGQTNHDRLTSLVPSLLIRSKVEHGIEARMPSCCLLIFIIKNQLSNQIGSVADVGQLET